MIENAPGVISLAAASSNFGPIPKANVPEITVIPSAVGCVCGATFQPAGVFSRIVNGPGFAGSPSRRAACAPAGNDGGAGPHFKSAAAYTVCSILPAGC